MIHSTKTQLPLVCTAAAGLVTCSCYTTIRKERRKGKGKDKCQILLKLQEQQSIRLLVTAEVVRPSGSVVCLSEKCHRIPVLNLGFLYCLVTLLHKFLYLFTINLKKSYRLLNPQKVSVQSFCYFLGDLPDFYKPIYTLDFSVRAHRRRYTPELSAYFTKSKCNVDTFYGLCTTKRNLCWNKNKFLNFEIIVNIGQRQHTQTVLVSLSALKGIWLECFYFIHLYKLMPVQLILQRSLIEENYSDPNKVRWNFASNTVWSKCHLKTRKTCNAALYLLSCYSVKQRQNQRLRPS